MLKKVFIFLLCAVMCSCLMAFAACGSDDVEPEDVEPEDATTSADYELWLASDDAYDYNKDGVKDSKDYNVYLERKSLVGKFVVTDFKYEIDSTEYTIQLTDSGYGIQDLKEDIGGFEFEVSKDLKLTCKYSDAVKAKLGNDEVDISSAINSCKIEKLSDLLTTAKFTVNGLDFTVYLEKADNGFKSNISVTIDGVQTDVTFNVVYKK